MYGAYGSTIFGPTSCGGCQSGYDGQGRDEIAAIQSALLTLGYKATDADKAVRQAADALGPGVSTEELIRKALGR